MTKPVRLKLSRAAGFQLADASTRANGLPAVVVARPGKWSNLFVVGRDGTRAECVDLFAKLLSGLVPITTKVTPAKAEAYRQQFLSDWHELQGKNLACWCPLDGPCHADALRDAVIIMEKGSDA